MAHRFRTTALLAAGITSGALGIAAVAGTSDAGAETATTDTPALVSTLGAPDAAQHGHPLRRALRRHEVEVAARVIGVSADDLRSALRDGSSVAEVAEAHHVPLDTVSKAVIDDLTPRIRQLVDRGRITQERADRLVAKLPTVVDRVLHAHRTK